MIKTDNKLSVNGTHGHGSVDVEYKRIVELFGEPNSEGDDYKTDAEWQFSTPFGVATLYNWKDGKNYNGGCEHCDCGGLDVEDITDWHIGALNQESADALKEALTAK
jgi:hypothetical protein